MGGRTFGGRRTWHDIMEGVIIAATIEPSETQMTFPGLRPDAPALLLAPMDGLTDAPMRAVQGEIGAFTFSVAEFVRVSATVVKPPFYKDASHK